MAAGGALSWRGGSPACVWTANDGPLQAGKKVTASLSDCASAANLQLHCTSMMKSAFLLQINK